MVLLLTGLHRRLLQFFPIINPKIFYFSRKSILSVKTIMRKKTAHKPQEWTDLTNVKTIIMLFCKCVSREDSYKPSFPPDRFSSCSVRLHPEFGSRRGQTVRRLRIFHDRRVPSCKTIRVVRVHTSASTWTHSDLLFESFPEILEFNFSRSGCQCFLNIWYLLLLQFQLCKCLHVALNYTTKSFCLCHL